MVSDQATLTSPPSGSGHEIRHMIYGTRPSAGRGSGRGGMKGYMAIAVWVRDVPPRVLTNLYLQTGAGPAGHRRRRRSGG